MRTQNEILEKIRQFDVSKTDPTTMQRKALIHKLTWENAKHFMKPEQRTEEQKKIWLKRSSLDEECILKEIDEQIDYTYMLISEKDLVGVMVSLQIILVSIWLLGPNKEKFIGIFYPEILAMRKDCGRSAMRKLCEEFGYRWNLYELRYLNEGDGIIIPTDEQFQKLKRINDM